MYGLGFGLSVDCQGAQRVVKGCLLRGADVRKELPHPSSVWGYERQLESRLATVSVKLIKTRIANALRDKPEGFAAVFSLNCVFHMCFWFWFCLSEFQIQISNSNSKLGFQNQNWVSKFKFQKRFLA